MGMAASKVEWTMEVSWRGRVCGEGIVLEQGITGKIKALGIGLVHSQLLS